MGTNDGKANKISYEIAILRAYNGQPILRYVAKRADGAIMVRSERSYQEFLNGDGLANWIGWRRNSIYYYEPSIFERLSALYQSEDQEKLDEEWAKLESLFY